MNQEMKQHIEEVAGRITCGGANLRYLESVLEDEAHSCLTYMRERIERAELGGRDVVGDDNVMYAAIRFAENAKNLKKFKRLVNDLAKMGVRYGGW